MPEVSHLFARDCGYLLSSPHLVILLDLKNSHGEWIYNTEIIRWRNKGFCVPQRTSY